MGGGGSGVVSGVVLGGFGLPNPKSKAETGYLGVFLGLSRATVVRQHNNPPLHSPIRLLFARDQHKQKSKHKKIEK